MYSLQNLFYVEVIIQFCHNFTISWSFLLFQAYSKCRCTYISDVLDTPYEKSTGFWFSWFKKFKC